jgi:sulfide:quinone oxidoreductase
MSATTIEPRRIVIAGGGVGAIEALLALRDLGEGAFDVVLVAPDDRLVIKAMTTAEPFAVGRSDMGALGDIAAELGAEWHRASLTAVDPEERVVHLSDNQDLRYDVLILAPGARRRAAFPTGITFGLGDPLALNGLLADLEGGYTRSVAFVVPDGITWSLPLYELALMTAAQVRDMGQAPRLVLVTPEPHPLAIFGTEASEAVAELFAEAGIELYCGADAAVGRDRVLLLGDDEEIQAERVVSLPRLEGPRVPGVPADAEGFIPVDGFARVVGLEGVYAIGDAADLPVKQGGLACQQADVAAAHIARAAGAEVGAEPLVPVLRGKLLTGRASRFLRREFGAAEGRQDTEPLWWPPAKVVGRYLGPWLAQRELPAHTTASSEPTGGRDEVVDVAVHLDPIGRLRPDVLGMDPLGPMRNH